MEYKDYSEPSPAGTSPVKTLRKSPRSRASSRAKMDISPLASPTGAPRDLVPEGEADENAEKGWNTRVGLTSRAMLVSRSNERMRKDDLLLLDEADVKPVHRHVEKGESKLGTQHSQHLPNISRTEGEVIDYGAVITSTLMNDPVPQIVKQKKSTRTLNGKKSQQHLIDPIAASDDFSSGFNNTTFAVRPKSTRSLHLDIPSPTVTSTPENATTPTISLSAVYAEYTFDTTTTPRSYSPLPPPIEDISRTFGNLSSPVANSTKIPTNDDFSFASLLDVQPNRPPSRALSTRSKKSQKSIAVDYSKRPSSALGLRRSSSSEEEEQDEEEEENGREGKQSVYIGNNKSRVSIKSARTVKSTKSLAATTKSKKSVLVEEGVVELTPQDRHYLNKMLVCLEMQREWSALSQIGALSTYGSPFLPHPNGPNTRRRSNTTSSGLFGGLTSMLGSGNAVQSAEWRGWQWERPYDSPILDYCFWRFMKNFPGLNEAKDVYWTDQIQTFFDSFAERNLSSTRERSEITKRRLLSMGLTRIIGTYFSTCVTSLQVSAPARPTLTIMRRIDNLFPGSMEDMWYSFFPDSPIRYNAWTAIVGTEIGSQGTELYAIVSKVLVTKAKPEFFVLRSYPQFKSFFATLASIDPKGRLLLPLPPFTLDDHAAPSLPLLQRYLRSLIIALSSPPSNISSKSATLTEARQELESFLLGKPEKLTAREMEEYMNLAKKNDRVLSEKSAEWQRIGDRSKSLRSTWSAYKDALIEGDELDASFAQVKKSPTIVGLPTKYRDTEAWASIWISYMLHYIFISSPSAAEILSLVKAFHDLTPYAALKLGLSLVNPTLAIRTIVAIVLGQPVGQPSLFQRIFQLVLGSGIRTQKKLIDNLRKKIDMPEICDAVAKHIYCTFEERADTQDTSGNSVENDEDILLTIIRNNCYDLEDVSAVESWHAAFVRRAHDPTLPLAAKHAEDSSDAGKYQSLKSLLRSYARKRDREQVLEIAMEYNTPVLLRSTISIFYSVIYKIANASNLSARLGDAQAFMDDLIKTSMSENNTPADLINLSRRHEQSIWLFIHELIRAGPLMDPMKEWCRSGLNFIRDGIPVDATNQSNRGTHSKQKKGVVDRAAVDYERMLSKSTPEMKNEILEEVRGLALWTKYKKTFSDINLRADLLAADLSSLKITRSEIASLYTDLLSQDQEVLNYLDAHNTIDAGRDEANDWCWFANEDIFDDFSAIKLDWRAAAAIEKSLYESRKKKKKSKKATANSHHTSGKLTTDDVPVVHPPRIIAASGLLEDYLDSISRSLGKAKEAEIR